MKINKKLVKFKSVLSKYRSIENRNKAFEGLSDEDKRREIAFDSLKLILNESIRGSLCSYWDRDLTNKIAGVYDSKEFQRILNKNLPSCSVCARGAVMLSQIRLGNSINFGTDHFQSGDYQNVKGFYMDSMFNMEVEYERNEFNHPFRNNSTKKLANILCNVIVNGDFNIADYTEYLI